MSNLQQQQSTICFLVEQCCENNESYNDYSQQIIMFIKQNQSKEVRPIVDTIKKSIKNKKNESTNKVLALKLFNDCLTQGMNEEFMIYSEKKIMRRLSILAKFRKETTDIDRGSMLFGKTYNQKASADFLKLLLIYIQRWSDLFPVYASTGKQTEINKIYQMLIKERVAFPPEEVVYAALSGSNYNLGNEFNRSIKKDQNFPNAQPAQQLQQSQIKPRQQQSSKNLHYNNNYDQKLINPQSQRASSSQNDNNKVIDNKSSQSSVQEENLSPASLARRMKEDYKKLQEYQSNAKLADEIFSQAGDSGENLDQDLLLELRGQLTEGKLFTERFLKTIMDESLLIRDKESKVKKILAISSEISDQLEKILIFKPYSPRALKKLEETAKELEKIPVQNKIQQQDSKRASKEDGSPKILGQKQSPFNKERKASDLAKSHKTFSLNQNINEDKLSDDPFKSQQFDFKNDNNIFKTNFAFGTNQINPQPQADFWGSNQMSSNFQSSQFSEFNSFKPIVSNFDQPSASSRFLASQVKQQDNLKQSQMAKTQIQESPQQLIQHIKKEEIEPQAQYSISEVEPDDDDKQVKSYKIIKKQPKEQLRVSAAPSTIPQHQKPNFNKHEQPNFQSQTVEFSQPILLDSKQIYNLTKNPQEERKTITVKNQNISSQIPQLMSKKNDLQFGQVLKPQKSIPSINNDSPDANLSDDDEETQIRDEKTNFNFPSPSLTQKLANNFQNEDFNWDFNNKVRTSNLNKPPANDNFGFSFKPNQQNQGQLLEDDSSKAAQQQNTHASNGFNFDNSQFIVHDDEISNQKSPEKFDFTLTQEQSQFQSDPSYVIHLNETIENLRSKVEELRKKNEELKSQLRSQGNSKYQLDETALKLKLTEKERDDKQQKIEELEDQVKFYKKFEYKYEQELFKKTELANEIAELQTKMEEYRKMADRQEHLVNRKEKELGLIRQELDSTKQKHQELQELYDRDMEDLKISESQTKKSLQNEVLESRKREEEGRVQAQKDLQEAKKREETLIKQHQIEIKNIQDKEESWKVKVIEMQEQRKTKEQELLQRIKKLEDDLVKSKEKVQTPQQKLIVRTSQIKFNKSNKSLKQEASERSNSIDQQQFSPQINFEVGPAMNQQEQMIKHHSENFYDSQQIMDSPNFFTSLIKPKSPQANEQENSIHVNNFDGEFSQLDKTSGHQQPQQDNKNKAQNICGSQGEDDEFETMPPVPSSDSDNEFSQPEQIASPKKDSIHSQVILSQQQQDDEEEKNDLLEEFKEIEMINQKSAPVTLPNFSSGANNQAYDFDWDLSGFEKQIMGGSINNNNAKSDTVNGNKTQNKKDDIWDFFDNQQDSNKNNQASVLDQTLPQDKAEIKKSPDDFGTEFNTLNQNDNAVKVSIQPDALIIEQAYVYDQDPNKEDSFFEMFTEIIKKPDEQKQIAQQSHTSPAKEEIVIQPLQEEEEKQQIQAEIDTDIKLKDQDSDKEISQVHNYSTIQEIQIDQTKADQNQIVNSQNDLSQLQQDSQKAQETIQSSPEEVINQHSYQQYQSPPSQQIPVNQQAQNSHSPPQAQQPPHNTENHPQNQQPLNNMSPTQPLFVQQNHPHLQTSPQSLNQPLNQQRYSPEDIRLDKSQFTTQSTELYREQQAKTQLRLDPGELLRQHLMTFFRKSLLSNKSVIYEDSFIQIGLVCEYLPNGIAKMKLYFGNKSQQEISQIKFSQAMKPIGFLTQQSKDAISSIIQGEQDFIDLAIKIDSFQFSIPMYSLIYSKISNAAMVRLPVVLLKFCNAIPQLDTQGFIFKWNFDCGLKTEAKQLFNIDFNQCRSLTQLKTVLQFGQNAFSFAEGVEQQKNIVCGGTCFSYQSPQGVTLSLIALVKITVTGDGQNCQILGRSNDSDLPNSPPGAFAKLVMSNILEMIAIKVQSN